MSYQVQRGDTIAQVTQRYSVSWERLRQMNPDAVGQSRRTGRWFLKEGAVIKTEDSFETVLKQKVEKVAVQNQTVSSAVDTHKKETWSEYIIKPGDTLWALAVKRFHVNVEDLIRDNNIEDPRKIMPGQKIRVRRQSLRGTQNVVASWYGEKYHGRVMANGEPFNMHANTIAHKNLPFGTQVELKNPETGQVEKAIVTDRGPYVAGRDVDLSYALAERLSLLKKGVGKLVMKVL
ncbi:MAG TPA: septal ring lytic transglycosylase RlpA family protein [Deltaproteobacteria bacterium]|nr:septal ring lytic transglycosylase RlpA family protein [Deltaproteobacteria bacterium]